MNQPSCHETSLDSHDELVTTLKPRDIGKALKLTRQIIANPRLTSLVIALAVACHSHPQRSPEKALIALVKGEEHESLL